MEVAGLHESPSSIVKIPGIAECPVNFECTVEFKKDYYTHGIVFARVLGASIDDEILKMSRQEVVNYYPTYEVDDKANKFGGSIERLGIMGEIFECPSFPHAPKAGWYQSFDTWMKDLADEKFLTGEELGMIIELRREYDSLYSTGVFSPRYTKLKDFFTKIPSYIVNDQWDDLRNYIAGF